MDGVVAGLSPAAEGDASVEYLVRVSPHGGWYLERDGAVVWRASTPTALRHGLFEDLQSVVIDLTVDRALIHAAVVGIDSVVVALPGSSRAGKSTLAAALVDVGAAYYSDELAILDEAGRAEAFPRPLVLRNDVADVVATPDRPNVGLPAKVAYVVFARYRDDGHWQPTSLGPEEAFAELVPNAVTMRTRPEVTLKALKALAEQAVCLKSDRGDALETAREIVSLVSGR